MKYLSKKKYRISILVIIAILLLSQFIRPNIANPAITKNIDVPADVQAILQRACYDCHSNETNLKWFDKITPANWLVANHIKDGRAALNFSEWDKIKKPVAKATLFRAINDIRSGEMPLKDYLLLHGDAKLSENDKLVLEQYLLSISLPVHYDTVHNNSSKTSANASAVKPSLTGIQYISGYTNWKAISTSDRFDNGTIRIIYANDIGADAIKNNHINPFPEGTILAKVAWKQAKDSLGNITAGDFAQVEFMIRDNAKYKETKGWGWARWVGKDLQPYGASKTYATECISCHQPVKDNDYIFTYPFQLK